jgi:hypothetical protein
MEEIKETEYVEIDEVKKAVELIAETADINNVRYDVIVTACINIFLNILSERGCSREGILKVVQAIEDASNEFGGCMKLVKKEVDSS